MHCLAGSDTTCTCKNTSLGVVSETSADMILHLGDFAYDFDANKGLMGDVFMRNIEPIACASLALAPLPLIFS